LSELPTAAIARTPTDWRRRALWALPWVLVSLPALYQLVQLATAITGRIGYPYDLEWMEGGLLHHAQRIQDGLGLYGPPSIDFIPYLYTPLYPSLLALLGGVFGLTYQLGRALSVLSLIGLLGASLFSIASKRHAHARLAPAIAAALLGYGLFAAAYPYMEGWYDLVRADTLFLYLVTGALAGLPRWSRNGTGLAGHARVAAGATLLALAFFCKQTGIIYVALGGLVVLVVNWRRAFTYAAVAGVIGLGGCALMQHTTDGWFWIYVRDIHAAHDFNMDRFYRSFGNILWHFPAMTIVTAAGLAVVAATAIAKRSLPRGTHALLLWAPAFAVSTLIGAIGWGTEFAHFNAYMPAFLHGGLAAGSAVVAIYACARVWWADRPHAELGVTAIGVVAAIPLALACYTHRWHPQAFVPAARDVAAGDALIARIRAIDGDVWVPSHPWYAELAGKPPHVHRMGIKDVTWRQSRKVLGLHDALAHHAFAAIVLDNRDLQLELPALTATYRAAFKLPKDERPRLFTGAKVEPDSIWVPARVATPPAGGRTQFDFEADTWGPWTASGAAWGPHPTSEPQPGQGLVLGASGRRFATSMWGGDAATGRVTSPPFTLDGDVVLKLGGTHDATKLRVELWVDDKIVGTAAAPAPGGDTLQPVTIDPGAARGARGTLVFVDDSPNGHLDVDDVWLVP
jgi:hypothetical protein